MIASNPKNHLSANYLPTTITCFSPVSNIPAVPVVDRGEEYVLRVAEPLAAAGVRVVDDKLAPCVVIAADNEYRA